MLFLLKQSCRLIDVVVSVSGKAAAWLMPLLAFIVAFEVFSRYVLDAPTIWAFDLSLFLFGYIAALGGAYAQAQRAHINVDILYLKVSAKTKRIFNLVTAFCAILFLLILIKMCFGKFQEALEYDYRRQSEWAPPMFHFWLMMCIAGGLFVAQFVRDMINDSYYVATGKHLLLPAATESEGAEEFL